MLRLGDEAPDFELPGVIRGEVRRFRRADFRRRWLVLFFYPADFTFVCPTELQGFQARLREFAQADATIAGVSADDVESHRAWVKELGGIDYPLLSDTDRTACRAYGVLNDAEGRPYRATFMVSPEARIAHMTISPMNVGRSVEETLRVIQALQTGRLCPADWRPGTPTLDATLSR
jgi:alkyl hydroperoxide reductase subunit AhpC